MNLNAFLDSAAPNPRRTNPSLQPFADKQRAPSEGQYFLKNQVIYRQINGKSMPKLALPGAPIHFPDHYTPEQIAAERPSRIVDTRDKRTRFEKMSSLIQMRDLVLKIMDLQEENADEDLKDPNNPPWAIQQTRLREIYSQFVRTHGALHTIAYRNSGHFNKNMVETQSPYYPNLEVLKKDPDISRLAAAVEVVHPLTGEIKPGPAFAKRWLKPYSPISSVKTLEQALDVALEKSRKIDFRRITALLEGDQAADNNDRQAFWMDQAHQKGLIFLNPESKEWIHRDEYLQGDIYAKLERAKRANAIAKHVSYQGNIDALQDCIPKPVTAESIPVELGMHWIPPALIQSFAQEELGLEDVRVSHIPRKNKWFVSAKIKNYDAATRIYGTHFNSSLELLKEILGQAHIEDTSPKNRPITNPDQDTASSENVLCEEKRDRIQKRFAEWVWENPKRRHDMEARFNRMFNARVQRAYQGKTLNLPGVSVFSPALRWNQMEGIVRNIESGDTGHFQPPGAGKTDLAVTLIHELKRRQFVNKPALICPNAQIVRQFETAHMMRYPRDNILVIDEVFDYEGQKLAGKEKLKRLADIISRGNYDAIYMTQSVFDSYNTRPDIALQRMLNDLGAMIKQRSTPIHSARVYVQDQIKDLHEQILDHIGVDKNNPQNQGWLKRFHSDDVPLDAKNAFWQEKVTPRIDPDTAYWEDIGIDWVGIDESHAYKNLEIHSDHLYMGMEGSSRARSLLDKVTHLRATYPDRAHHISMMTATPLTNNPLYEVYTILRLLDPEALKIADIQCFDSFLAMSGRKERAVVLSPNGADYRTAEHYSRFKNIDLWRRTFSYRGHIIQEKDLGLPKPEIEYDSIVVEPSERLEILMEWFKERYDAVASGGSLLADVNDNPLNIITDGRMAAITPKLVWHRYLSAQRDIHGDSFVEPEFDEESEYTKIDAAADFHAQMYHRHKNTHLESPGGQQDPVPGILQLNFCDIGVPKTDGTYSVYDDLKEKLIARGVPAAEIKFIHDFENPALKASLERECNTGKVSILICSSEKAARGLNIHRRAGVVVNSSVPWTDDWITQRNGRMDRSGALIDTGQIRHMITRGSHDEFSWQTLQLKAEEIYHFMSGQPVDYGAEPKQQIHYYATYRSQAARDERLFTLVELEQNVLRLKQMQEAENAQKQSAAIQCADMQEKLNQLTKDLSFRELLQQQSLSPTAPLLVLNGEEIDDTDIAQEAMAKHLRDLKAEIRKKGSHEGTIGKIMGADLSVKARLIATPESEPEGQKKNYVFELFIGNCPIPITLTEDDIKARLVIMPTEAELTTTFNKAEDMMPRRGLVIGKEWASKIIQGNKIWELRKQGTNIRERFAIIAQGTKTIIGTVELIDCLGPLSPSEMIGNIEKMGQTLEETERDISDGYVHAWVLSNPIAFKHPVPYHHPSGAQSWVNLSEQFSDAHAEVKTDMQAEISPIINTSQSPERERYKVRAKISEKLFSPLRHLDDTIVNLRQSIKQTKAKISTAKHIINGRFEYADELHEARQAYEEMKLALQTPHPYQPTQEANHFTI
jgi:N12 class adenine-specific DNA methylase